jgi:hypothetical protein
VNAPGPAYGGEHGCPRPPAQGTSLPASSTSAGRRVPCNCGRVRVRRLVCQPGTANWNAQPPRRRTAALRVAVREADPARRIHHESRLRFRSWRTPATLPACAGASTGGPATTHSGADSKPEPRVECRPPTVASRPRPPAGRPRARQARAAPLLVQLPPASGSWQSRSATVVVLASTLPAAWSSTRSRLTKPWWPVVAFRPYGGRVGQLSKWSALPAQAAG